MRQGTLVFTLFSAFFVVFGLNSIAAARGPLTHADVYSFDEPDEEVGGSWLIRRENEIVALLHTVVEPWHTMTLWWVIFNEPDDCISEGGCGEDDVFGDPGPAMTSVMFADGAVAGPGGHLTLTARLYAEDLTNETLFGPGLLYPDAAEVHLVVRSHGPVDPSRLFEQIGSFAGGCDVFMNPPEIPDAIGECADIQFAIHKP